MNKLLLILFLLFGKAYAQCDTVEIHHKYYAICFDTTLKLPVYVSYEISAKDLNSVVKRSAAFTIDKLIDKKYQWTNRSYYKTNYDKGHLNNDKINRFNYGAEKDCMVMTNIAPQNKYFNRHLWLAVENAERDSCQKYNFIEGYTGCVYGKQTINGMRIPLYYWKLIEADGHFIAAWLGKNEKPKSNSSEDILVSKETIEKTTGLRFKLK